jgi:hypothetical protein
LLTVAGDTEAAEERFMAADRIAHTDDPDGEHLPSIVGVWWGELLARTGRTTPARQLTDRNRVISTHYGWNEDVARCDRLLGQLDLTVGDTAGAESRLAAAAATFRDGDFLIELAQTLPVLADCARARGDLTTAQRHATEAITIAAPRGLRLAHTAALTAQAHLHADHATTTGNPDHLAQGRDAADAANRIATHHQLAWHHLDALDAHTHLDRAEGTDHGWANQATALRARLIPAGLDPNPLATVERLVAQDKSNPTGR